MKEEIINKYDQEKVIYIELESKIKDLINSLLKEKGIAIHGIESRVKDRGSLSKKIAKNDGKYLALNEITDALGLRVITYFEDDVDKVANIIKSEFYLDVENSVDKRDKNPESFGYSSLHYILKLKKPRADLSEYSRFNDYKFELQIRSILQHAWAEIEHDLGYKSKNEVPKEIRRDFSRVAGLLEIADNEFIRIKKFLQNYTREVERKIEEESFEILIDKVTLREYIEKSPTVSKVIKDICKIGNVSQVEGYTSSLEKYIKALKFFGISTISQLDLNLKENSEKIVKFFVKWTEGDEKEGYIQNDVAIYYLFYVLLYENYSEDELEEYSIIFFGNYKVKKQVRESFQKLLDENFTL